MFDQYMADTNGPSSFTRCSDKLLIPVARAHNDRLNNCLNKAKHTHKITAAEHVRTWARSPPLGFSRFKLHQFPPTASTLDWVASGLTECTRVILTVSPLTLQCTQVSNSKQVSHHH